MSVPNQKIITIAKTDSTPPFLQLNEKEWIEAFKNLTKTELCLYFLLARNQKNYRYEFSPQAIENTGLMRKGSASKAFKALQEKGYIVDGKFYTASLEQRKEKEKFQKNLENGAVF